MRLLFVCFSTVLLFAGCVSKKDSQSAMPATNRVEWLGHLCVQVTTPIGTKILINPYRPGSTRFTLPSPLKADVVLITRETPDSSNAGAVDGTPSIFRGSVGIGTNNAGGVRILGTPIFPDSAGNAMNAIGMNLVYSWRSGGMKFCYLGPISRVLTPAEALQIGRVDVLFLPIDVGGLSNAERNAIVRELQPKLIVPIAFSSGSVSAFASSYQDVFRLPDRAFKVRADMLENKAAPTVLIFGN